MDKASFLKNELVSAIENIPVDQRAAWGKMNLQQMTEHLSRDAFRVASGKVNYPVMAQEEHIPKLHAFIMSDKSFKENTVNRLMAEEPVPVIHRSMPEALSELRQEIDYFFETYKQEPEKKIINPFFGELDYTLQVNLLHKHAMHHLRQFGITF